MAIKASTLRTSKRDDGRFDSILYSLLEDRDLPDDATFECLLSLPGTEYQITQKLSYQPGTFMKSISLLLAIIRVQCTSIHRTAPITPLLKLAHLLTFVGEKTC